jgi:hypothetical protein
MAMVLGFLCRERRERREKLEETREAAESEGRGRRGARVPEGIRGREIKREGKVVWWKLLPRGPQEHAPLVLACRRPQGR